MSTAARLARLALAVVAVLGVTTASSLLVAKIIGVEPVVVRSGSMAPTFDAGALLIARETPAADVRPGQVATVTRADGSRVSHRVVSVDAGTSGRVTMELRGDANPAPDAEPVSAQTVGVMVTSIPRVGSVIAWFSRPAGNLLVITLAAILLSIAIRPPRALERGATVTSSSIPAVRRAPRRRRPRRPLGFASSPAAALVTLAVVACVIRVSPASAAWNDRASASADVTVASIKPAYVTAPGCVVDSTLRRVRVSWRASAVPTVTYTAALNPGGLALLVQENTATKSLFVDVPYALLTGLAATNVSSVVMSSRRGSWTGESVLPITYDRLKLNVSCGPWT